MKDMAGVVGGGGEKGQEFLRRFPSKWVSVQVMETYS